MANQNDINLRIGISGASDVTKSLKEVDSVVRKMSDGVSDVSRKMSQAGSSLSGLQAAKSPFKTIAKDSDEASKAIGLTRQQSLALTYTFNDVTASLASGISPLTILLQQGGQLTQAFGGLGGTLSTLLPTLLRLAPAFAAVGVAGFAAFEAFSGISKAREAVTAINDLSKGAKEAGLSFRDFQKVVSASGFIGADANGLTAGLGKINDAVRELQNAQRGLPGATDKFKQLGIQLRYFQASTLTTSSAIQILRDKYASLSSQWKKDVFADRVEKLFGKDVVTLITTNSASIDKFSNSLNKMVAPLNSVDAALAKTAQQTQALYDAANQRLELQIGAAFIPALTEINKYLIATFQNNLPLIRNFANQITEVFRVINGDALAMQRNPNLTALISAFRELQTAGSGAASAIGSALSEVYDRIGQLAVLINQAFGTNFTAATLTATAAIGTLLATLGPVGIAIDAIGLAIAASIKYWPELSAAATTAAEQVNAAWTAVKDYFAEIWTSISTSANAAWESVVSSVRSFITTIQSVISSISFNGIWDGFVNAAESAFNQIRNGAVNLFNDIINSASQILRDIGNAFSNAGRSVRSAFGFASGGYVSGPGTGTSDSIPAWLSNGEFVIRADAVKRFGVDFLNRINGMSIDPSEMMGRFGYAGGGLVSIPAGIQSSPVGSSRTFNLVLDGRSFDGLTGTNKTIADLERYAVMRQMSATSKRSISRMG